MRRVGGESAFAQSIDRRAIIGAMALSEGLAHQIDITARTIFGEARGETGLVPLEAVAWVIRNRAESRDQNGHARWWGDTPAKVCQKAQQFSCWNADDPNLPVIQGATLDQPRFAECFGVACLVLGGTSIGDPTLGATHYHSDGIPAPWWVKTMTQTIKIGNHIFYKG